MVQFNELNISVDGKSIIIDVQVKDLNYYEDVYLDTIKIDTHTSFQSAGISSTPIYKKTISGDVKRFRVSLDEIDLNKTSINNNLFFVYVTVKGTPLPDTPCGMDNITTLGTITDTYSIYKKGMDYFNEVQKDCSIPKQFIDMILKQKAFETALYTQNYPQAIKYWEKFFQNKTTIKTYDCGCG